MPVQQRLLSQECKVTTLHALHTWVVRPPDKEDQRKMFLTYRTSEMAMERERERGVELIVMPQCHFHQTSCLKMIAHRAQKHTGWVETNQQNCVIEELLLDVQMYNDLTWTTAPEQ